MYFTWAQQVSSLALIVAPPEPEPDRVPVQISPDLAAAIMESDRVVSDADRRFWAHVAEREEAQWMVIPSHEHRH